MNHPDMAHAHPGLQEQGRVGGVLVLDRARPDEPVGGPLDGDDPPHLV